MSLRKRSSCSGSCSPRCTSSNPSPAGTSLLTLQPLNTLHQLCMRHTIPQCRGAVFFLLYKHRLPSCALVTAADCCRYIPAALFISQFSTAILRSQRGTRQAPECLDPGHISVRSRELLKAEKRRFYIGSPFAEICPHAFPTYNTAGRRDAIVSTCSPLLNRFMIKVSTQYTINLVGILVAYLGRSAIKLLLTNCA